MRIFQWASVLSCFVFISSPLLAEEHSDGTGTKQHMTFHASFDRNVNVDCTNDSNINADAANGSTRGTILTKLPMEKILVPGLQNQSLRIGYDPKNKERYTVDYSPEKNISVKTGTVTFWVKPEDWKADGKQFNIFFSTRTTDAGSNIYIYKYSGANLSFYENYKDKPKETTNAQTDIRTWLPGEWHFIACTWTPKEFRLYVDGKQKSAVARKYCPSATFAQMRLGSRGWEVESGLSLIDDVKIYSKALTIDDIAAEYAKYAVNNQEERPTLTVGKRTPVRDGKISPGEYAFTGTGFLDTRGKYANKQSHYGLSYDADNLYVAVSSPQKTPLKSDNNLHDSSVWNDDSVELWLYHKKTNTKYQIIINSKNTVFDAKYTAKLSDSNWNLKDMRSSSRLEGGIWTVELSCPLAAFHMNPGDQWQINIARTFQADGIYYTCIAPVRHHLGYSDSLYFFGLALNPNAPVVDIAKIGNLNSGNIDFELTSSSPKTVCNLSYTTATKCWFDETLKNTSDPAEPTRFIRKDLNPGGCFTINILDGADVIYRGFFEAKFPSPVTAQYIYTDIPSQSLRLVVKNESEADQGKIIISLADRNSNFRKEHGIPVVPNQLVYEIPWDISGIPAGDYDFEAVYIGPDGKKGEKFIQRYRKTSSPTPWDNTAIGIFKDVPPPWIPLKTDSTKVQTLKQTYTFGKELLPAAIQANRHEITTRPLVVSINGETDENRAQVKLLKNTPRQAVFLNSAQIGDVKLDVTVKVDYDGMLWVNLLLSPADGKTEIIKEMHIDIPLKKEFAEQVHANAGDTYRLQFGRTGIVPDTGWHKDLFKKPAFWVGSDNAGISWFAETLKGWHMKDHNRSVEIIPCKNESIIRLNLVDTPLKLDGKREISFGFQGTPVKDIQHKSIRCNRLGKEWGWSNWYKNFNYFDPSPEFIDFKELNYHRDNVYKNSSRFFFYIAPNGASPYNPYWGYWGKIWTSRPLGDYIIETDIRSLERRNKWVWTYSCLNSKSFRDFFLWSFERCLDDKKINIQNLYYDLVGPRMCDNSVHGCGWTDDWGNHYSTMNLLGTREFLMRVYELMKKKRPESMHIYHITNAPAITAVTSFADALVDGETFFGNELVEKETYFGIYAPKSFRVAYYGQKWGTPSIYTCQLQRSAYWYNPAHYNLWSQADPPLKMKKAMRHFLGYTIVHDTQIWDSNKNLLRYQDDAWEIFRKFLNGWNGSEEFIPYWHADSPVKISSDAPQSIMGSVYRRDDRAVLAIMNDTSTAQAIRITVDGKKLFGHPCKTTVMTKEGKNLSLEGNSWISRVPEEDFSIYLIKPD